MLHDHRSFRQPLALVSSGKTTLSDILGAFTYALDLTEGQPEGHSLRCTWIAMRLADMLGIEGAARRDIYYAVMLKDLGCSSNAARIAELYLTDDRAFKRDYKLLGTDLPSILGFVFRKTGRGHRLADRAKAIGNIIRNGPEIARSLIETRCVRGAEIARKLRFSEDVANAIHSLDEHWDGGGKPAGLAGETIPLAARIALLAQIVDSFFVGSGSAAALAEVAGRAGRWLDPALCRAFIALASDGSIWSELAADHIATMVSAIEPVGPNMHVDEDYLDDIAAAFGEVIDAKSPYTSGHSQRVGDYADRVAAILGLSASERRALRRAAILHDVGKLGVSSAILEKPGKLEADEWHIMQNHAVHTAAILGRIAAMQDMAMIAGAHHERLDGAGYPLRLDARTISRETRIITVCDFYDALTADRPYRAAMPVDEALAVMAGEVGKAIDADCFEALKRAIAH
ncbi:MAG: HD domain-containing protein [Sphingobium sp.]|nr:HD domain-containing protein [Sphingobium sp.]